MLDTPGGRSHCAAEGGLSGLGLVDCGRHGAWHVARYNPAEHRLVQPALHRIGVSTFLPLIREVVPDRRLGRRARVVPAFTGCVFVQWPAGFHWPRILGQPGIVGGPSGLVRPVGDPYGNPATVPEHIMAELFERARDGGVIEDASAPAILSPLEPGCRVRVVRGPLAGMTGLCGLPSGQRVAVLIEAVSGERRVSARRRDLEAL